MKDKNTKEFKQGDVVKCHTTIVLVTGPGNEDAGYPCFAGVVLKELPEVEKEPWEVGFYSDTWTLKVFKKTRINLKKLLPDT